MESLPITIQSVRSPGVYLRMESEGGKVHWPAGFGKVDCSYEAGPLETFILHYESAQEGDFYHCTIESSQFPNVFLRMDPGPRQPPPTPHGYGTVNCQYKAGKAEGFKIIMVRSALCHAIESRQAPGNFLRMDTSGEPGPDGGFGAVNCQSEIGVYEQVKIISAKGDAQDAAGKALFH